MTIRIWAATALLLIMCLSRPGHGEADVDLTTSLTVGSRSGFFAAVYNSEENNVRDTASRETGIVSTQLSLLPGCALSINLGRTTFQSNYELALSNQIHRNDRFDLNIYHQVGLGLTSRLTRTLDFSADANAGMGILEYSSLLSRFDADTELAANLPPEQQVRFVNVAATVGITKQFSRPSSGNVSVSYNSGIPFQYRETDASTALPFSIQHRTTFQLGYTRQLTNRDSFNSDVSASFVANSPGPEFVPIALLGGWTHIFSETSNLRLTAGVLTAYQFEMRPDDEDDEEETPQSETLTYWMPQGTVAYQNSFNLSGRKILTTGLSASVNVYFDRVTASIRQQALLGIGLGLRLPSRWTFSAQVTFSTLLTPDPAGTDTEEVEQIDYPTAASVDVGADYLITDDIAFRMGVTSSARWSHLGDSVFRARAFEEFLLYVSITAVKQYLE